MRLRVGSVALLLGTALAFLCAVAPTLAEDARTGAAAWVKAPTCCAGCKYPNTANCCCAKRDALPVTSTKRVFKGIAGTKKLVSTATLTKTIVKKARKARRDLGEVEAAVEQPAAAEHELFGRQAGRHLCPVCPAGVKLGSGKTSSGGNGCCPKRRTIKKTVTAKRWITRYTKTATKMATVAAYRVAIKGKLLNKKKRAQKNVLISAVRKSAKKRLGARGYGFPVEAVPFTDITGPLGEFSLEGVVEPGPLEFYAGEIFIGDLVINPTGTVENGGDLGTIVEDPIPPFTPTCTMPTQTIAPAGSILARAQLGNGRLVGEIGTDVVSAQISKSPLLINDWVVEGEYYQIGSYMSLDTHGSVLNIQISPKTAGQKVVITGVGLKSAAFSTAKEGFRYIVRANPTAAYVDASDYFVWDKGCPDDGQLKQVYLSSPGSETPWDMPYVSLSLMNPTSSGRWHLSDLEVYGYAVDAPVWTTATTGETLPTTEAAATTAAPPPAETTAPVDPATPTEVIPTGPSTTENPCQTPTTLPSLTWPATYPVLISWPGQNNMTAIVNYYDKTVNHAYTFDDVLSMNSTADWYASTIVTGSAGTGGGMKFEFETNATFRVAAVRLVHTKNLAAAAGTQLEFFAYQGSTVYKLGNYTYLAECPDPLPSESIFDHFVEVPNMGNITKFTFEMGLHSPTGQEGSKIEWIEVHFAGRWCDTADCTF